MITIKYRKETSFVGVYKEADMGTVKLLAVPSVGDFICMNGRRLQVYERIFHTDTDDVTLTVTD